MKHTGIRQILCSIVAGFVLLAGLAATAAAGSDIILSGGQTVYVPI